MCLGIEVAYRQLIYNLLKTWTSSMYMYRILPYKVKLSKDLFVWFGMCINRKLNALKMCMKLTMFFRLCSNQAYLNHYVSVTPVHPSQ